MAYSSGTPNEYFPSGSGNITSALRLVYDRRVPATDDARHKLNRSQALVPGAKVCMGLIGLSDFELEFARWNISTEVNEC
jgi:hypothetical protein